MLKIKIMLKIICLFILLASAPEMVSAQILINEIYATPPTNEKEWLELINTENTAISIKDWKIAELVNGTIKNHEAITKDNEATIGAKGLIVFEPTKVTLNNSGDTIYLIDETGQIIDTVTFPKLDSQKSYSRKENNPNEWILNKPTKGKTNYEEENNDSNYGENDGYTNINIATNDKNDSKQEQKNEGTNNKQENSESNEAIKISKNEQPSWRKKVSLKLPKFIYREQKKEQLMTSKADEATSASEIIRLQNEISKKNGKTIWDVIIACFLIISGLLIVTSIVGKWWLQKKDDNEKVVEF